MSTFPNTFGIPRPGETLRDGGSHFGQTNAAVGLVEIAAPEPAPVLAAVDAAAAVTESHPLHHGTEAALGEQLDAFGIEYRVESVRRDTGTEGTLTDHQRDLVRAAVERGYYDTPRACTLTDVADELGLAKSSVSGTLHRAEERIVKEFVGERPEPVESALLARTE